MESNMRRVSLYARAVLLFALVAPLHLYAQSTVTITPSITSGDGVLTIPTLSWSTSPPISTGTPCTATSTPASTAWDGPKAGSGTVTDLGPFTVNTRLTLSCQFP